MHSTNKSKELLTSYQQQINKKQVKIILFYKLVCPTAADKKSLTSGHLSVQKQIKAATYQLPVVN
ncbi:unnamed protein product [Rhodiola kirilowii]